MPYSRAQDALRANQDHTGEEADWFWVDLPRLRQGFLDAGFTEHHRTSRADEPERVVLMTRAAAGRVEELEVLLPVSDDHPGWRQQARTALNLLEYATGRPRPDLGALTEREAALWRVIAETRAVAAPDQCRGHQVDAAGNISHHTERGDFDMFEHGRCEMRLRVAARLEHVLSGGE